MVKLLIPCSSSRKTSSLTKLEVGVVGTDVVAGTQQALHHQSSSHGIEQTKVLWDATFLDVSDRRHQICDSVLCLLFFRHKPILN